jgi:hypothetical protein
MILDKNGGKPEPGADKNSRAFGVYVDFVGFFNLDESIFSVHIRKNLF